MSKERDDSLFSGMSVVYCQVGGGPAGIGNQETDGRGFVYAMPNDVSDSTPMSQAPRMLVGMGGAEGPFGPEDSTHRDCVNGTAIRAYRDPNGNYWMDRIIARDTGPEIMNSRGGAQGENVHNLNTNKPPTKG